MLDTCIFEEALSNDGDKDVSIGFVFCINVQFAFDKISFRLLLLFKSSSIETLKIYLFGSRLNKIRSRKDNYLIYCLINNVH